MGCWNETCMLTRLPILHGEPCLAALMVPTDTNRRNMTDPSGMYVPIVPPIYGNYDDYGHLNTIKNIQEASSCLAAIQFRLKHKENGETAFGRILNISRELLDQASAEQAIQIIMEYANRCELEALIDSPGRHADWKPIYLALMKEPFAEMLIQNNIGGISIKEPIAFRLKTVGPLRNALRKLDTDYYDTDMPVNGPYIDKTAAMRFGALLSGMEAMRIGFMPQCGAGGQDAMDEPWQREFYQKAWTAAETIARRYDENILEPPAL